MFGLEGCLRRCVSGLRQSLIEYFFVLDEGRVGEANTVDCTLGSLLFDQRKNFVAQERVEDLA